MTEHSENPTPDGAPTDSTPDATRATSDPTPPSADPTPTEADATPTQALPPHTGATPSPASGALPAAPVPPGAPIPAPAPPARPFWSRTGTRIGAGVVGAALVLMIGFGGGWIAHGVLRPFGMHEQAWGPGGDRGMMHDGFGPQRGTQDGPRFGDGQRPGGMHDGDSDDDGSNGSDDAPTPGSTTAP
jgi:hypothetical protein